MPTINERKLVQFYDAQPCFHCSANDGDVYICGEGSLCSSCFADMADIPESDVLQEEVPEDARIRAKLNLMTEREEHLL